MSTVSLSPSERARKSVQAVLLRLQGAGTASVVASAMGVSEATVSRIKNERMEETLLFLAHLGYKMVPVEYRCVNSAAYEFLTQTHNRVMQVAPELIWDIEE